MGISKSIFFNIKALIADRIRKIDLVDNRLEFEKYVNMNREWRREKERLIINSMKNKQQIDITIFCEACNKKVSAGIDWLYSENGVPNFRERVTCPYCQLNNR